MDASSALADAVRSIAARDHLSVRQTPQMSGAMLSPDAVLHSHTSMRPDLGVTPHQDSRPHPMAQAVLDRIQRDVLNSGGRPPTWHGHCAEVALVSDRLYDLEHAWREAGGTGDFESYALGNLNGSVISTHRIGDLQTLSVTQHHGDLTPPCTSCAPFLDAFGVDHVADGGPGAPDGQRPTGGPGPDGSSTPPDGTPVDRTLPDVGALPNGSVDATRPYGVQGGLDHVDPADQARLDGQMPRHPDGRPQSPPNLFLNDWLAGVNGDGPNAPGRANNCTDCVASFAASWFGDPTVAAPTLNHTAAGEVGGPQRLEALFGTSFSDFGDLSGLSAIADQLRQAGPGSMAAVLGYYASGGGHAWSMVNQDGDIYIVDAQWGEIEPAATTPSWTAGMDQVYGIVLGPDAAPFTPPAHGAATPTAQPDGGPPASEANGPDGDADQGTDPVGGHSMDGADTGPRGREAAVDAVLDRLDIDDPAAAEALRTAYDVVHEYTAPFMVEIVDRMLADLRVEVARNPEAVVTFVGRDGHSMAIAAQRLDPDFFDANCEEIVLSRAVVESAVLDLERNAGMSFPGIEDFRQAAGKVDPADIPGAADRLEAYLHEHGLPVGRPGSEVILVDTSYKGTVQELLAALYPDTTFSGRYAFFGASPLDPHPGTKTGYALHLEADASNAGRPVRDLPVEQALTFANADAIGVIEETLHGDLSSPRGFSSDGAPAQQPQRYEPVPRGLNPTLVSPAMADPLVREGVKAANLLAVADYAVHIADVRRDGGDPRAELTAGSDRFRDQVRQWVSRSTGVDPAFREVMDSFVRRGDKALVTSLASAIDRAGLTGEQARRVWESYEQQPTLADRETFVRDFSDPPSRLGTVGIRGPGDAIAGSDFVPDGRRADLPDLGSAEVSRALSELRPQVAKHWVRVDGHRLDILRQGETDVLVRLRVEVGPTVDGQVTETRLDPVTGERVLVVSPRVAPDVVVRAVVDGVTAALAASTGGRPTAGLLAQLDVLATERAWIRQRLGDDDLPLDVRHRLRDDETHLLREFRLVAERAGIADPPGQPGSDSVRALRDDVATSLSDGARTLLADLVDPDRSQGLHTRVILPRSDDFRRAVDAIDDLTYYMGTHAPDDIRLRFTEEKLPGILALQKDSMVDFKHTYKDTWPSRSKEAPLTPERIAELSETMRPLVGRVETALADLRDWARAQENESEQRAEAVAANQKLTDNLNLSLAAFEKVFDATARVDFGPPPLPPRPGERPPPIRPALAADNTTAMIEAILDFYEQFAEQNQTNPRLRLDAARAYRRVGEMQTRLGRPHKAAPAFRRAVELTDDLYQEFPDSPDVAHELIVAYSRLPSLFPAEPGFDERLAGFLRATTAGEALRKHRPVPAGPLADVYQKLGDMLERAGKVPEALRAYHAAALLRAQPPGR